MNSSAVPPTIIEHLRGIFTLHGQPLIFVRDNSQGFNSEEFKLLMSFNEIHPLFTTDYCASSNTKLNARTACTFKEAIKQRQVDRKRTLNVRVSHLESFCTQQLEILQLDYCSNINNKQHFTGRNQIHIIKLTGDVIMYDTKQREKMMYLQSIQS